MSFVDQLNLIDETGKLSPRLRQFRSLLDEISPAGLESMANRATSLTRQHFGRTMRMFAPIYVSNECVNNCSYCGFSRDNPILRTTLSVEEVVKEARHLMKEGFRNILLVAGEHPKFVSDGYLEACINAIRDEIPGISIEVGPMERPEYVRMVKAGCEGLVVYQETYDREAYKTLHTAGPKKNFDWRIDCPERGYDGGFRRIGIGILLGLTDWREDALRLAAHLDYLYKTAWKASFTISLPRLRPTAGEFQPSHFVSDAEFVQIMLAFRICFPQVGLVLSTRETPELRDALFPLGITMISAGSHTEPGGYTGSGSEDIHLTVRGRRVERDESTDLQTCGKVCQNGVNTDAAGQFEIADERSPGEIASKLSQLGLEPVWKDWDASILSTPGLTN
ncbi:MAG: 2-iminoacetate synthase ThiH [Verrucomicrobiales bacterium]|nr:2-iminoacetate synthase ThiH [Verrucomicrobiales bacterium]